MPNKIKSFTLAELLIVMVITAIVIGMAFTVLRLVQNQIITIRKNTAKSEQILLLEQQLWQDFNTFGTIEYHEPFRQLSFYSPKDTIRYQFQEDFALRNADTIGLQLVVHKLFLNGQAVKNGNIDALSLSVEREVPDYLIFVSRTNDATFYMNDDGF